MEIIQEGLGVVLINLALKVAHDGHLALRGGQEETWKSTWQRSVRRDVSDKTWSF